jgi:N-acetylmuramic acid 6-phosphate etherase
VNDLRASTEARNPATVSLDTVDTAEMLGMLFAEESRAIAAVTAVTDQIARAVDEAAARLEQGAAVHYFGAGASGRLAVLDATEMTPTFGVDPGLFRAHFPGGEDAFLDSTIDLEDSESSGYQDAAVLNDEDIVIGITASGETAYVGGALRRARETGALTILITCNPQAKLRELADILIAADTGPEALMGSTRLKAGTATKVIVNAFSTALMVRSGRTYSNLMVGLTATNAKLRERAVAILMEASSKNAQECQTALADSGGVIPAALIALVTGCSAATAQEAFSRIGTVRGAIADLESDR